VFTDSGEVLAVRFVAGPSALVEALLGEEGYKRNM
jgi:hypothetical protein